jgi:hypothetical protein
VIVAVIVLGAAYVSYGMFMQASQEVGQVSSPMPRVHTLSPVGRSYLSAGQNPYVAALLAPRVPANKIREAERFAELLHKRLGEFDNKKAPGSVPISTPRPSTAGPVAAMPLTGPAKDGLGTGAYDKTSDAQGRQHVAKLLNEIEAAYDRGEMDSGLTKVNEALASLPGPKERIDVLLSGVRLSFQAHNFDQSRSYVSEAIDLAHQNQDYKMDDLEGLRCLLNGNASEAADFDVAMSEFNESLSKSDFAKLPALANALVSTTKSLPDDSFFLLRARVSQATSMLLSGGSKPGEAEAYIKKVEALAQKAHDVEVVANCEELRSKINRD